MYEFFLEKFKDKNNDELLNILNNKTEYQHAAVDAAIKVYNDRNNTNIPFYKRDDEIEQIQPLNRRAQSYIVSLKATDFYTLFTTAMGVLAIYSLISVYGDEFFLRGNSSWIKNLVLCCSFLVIHIFYKSDHQKSNSYIKRIQFDLLYLLILLGLEYLLTSISDGFNLYSLNFSFQTIGAIIGVFLFLLLLELVLEIIKKLFQFLRIGIL